MALTKCRVVGFRYTESLVSADVVPKTGDEEVALDQQMVKRGKLKKTRPIKNQMSLANERYEAGLAVTLEVVASKRRYERFFSASELAAMAGIPRPLNRQEMEFFGEKLKQRTEPICVGVFDRNVELNRVKVQHKPKDDGILLAED